MFAFSLKKCAELWWKKSFNLKKEKPKNISLSVGRLVKLWLKKPPKFKEGKPKDVEWSEPISWLFTWLLKKP